MADNENGAAPATQPQIKMNILGQFIRDLSFENVVVTKVPARRNPARNPNPSEP